MTPPRLFPVVLALLLAGIAHASTITGRLVGHDGTPVPYAVVQVTSAANGSELARVDVDGDGHYALDYAGEGLFVVRGSAPHHAALQVPVLLYENDRVELDARLATYAYRDFAELDAVRVVGEFNGWSYQLAVPVEREPDGVYRRSFEVSDGRFAYQILDAVDGRSIAGPGADAYEFDGTGDYRSIIETDDTLLDLEIDPAAFMRGSLEPVIQIDAEHRESIQLMVPSAEVEARRDRFLWRLSEARATANPSLLMQPLRDDLAMELPAAVDAARASGGPSRAAWYVNALQNMRLAGVASSDPEFVEEALAILGSTDPLWSLAPELVGYVASVKGFAAAKGFLWEVASVHPDRDLRKTALVMGYSHAFRSGDGDAAREFANRLVAAFPDAPEVANAKRLLIELDTKVRPGEPAPPFELQDLDGNSLALNALRGQVVLLDFWATWCRPCIEEIPTMRDVHERFGDDGFVIVSLSVDRSPDVIGPFREKRPMPWTHAHLEGELEHAVAKAYDVTSLPKPVLIGPDGLILAVGQELRGNGLLARVEAAIGDVKDAR